MRVFFGDLFVERFLVRFWAGLDTENRRFALQGLQKSHFDQTQNLVDFGVDFGGRFGPERGTQFPFILTLGGPWSEIRVKIGGLFFEVVFR